MALVFDDPLTKLQIAAMRCSSCREMKPIGMFPASCAYWRRGACKGCRKSKAELGKADAVLKKLEAARHRYKSAKGVKRADAAALLEGLGVDITACAEVAKWRLEILDPEKPFTKENMAWRQLGTIVDSIPTPLAAVCAKTCDEL